MKKSVLIFLVSILLVSGCVNIVTKECLYNDGSWKAMGVLCNDNGINDCIKIKDNIDKFKSIETEKLSCVTTELQKITSSSGTFVQCVSADDCYRVLEIQKPFDEFNLLVCDQEFCKTTSNYMSELVSELKKPSETSNEIQLTLVGPTNTSITNTTTSSTSTSSGLHISETGCGEGVCGGNEDCDNCQEDCGCTAAVAYCNTTKSPPMCMHLPESS